MSYKSFDYDRSEHYVGSARCGMVGPVPAAYEIPLDSKLTLDRGYIFGIAMLITV
jgi:hypothetical protein